MAGQFPDLLDRSDTTRIAVLDVEGEHVVRRPDPADRVEEPVGHWEHVVTYRPKGRPSALQQTVGGCDDAIGPVSR